MIIRRAEKSDLNNLVAAARYYFDQTFSPDNDPKAMADYMNTAFTMEQFSKEFEEKGSVFLIAEDGLKIQGYARIRYNDEADYLLKGSNMEIQRLYLDPASQGKGIADQLMDECIRLAAGVDWLWLGVWEKNPRAIRFYARHGFSKIGEHHFKMGDEDQTDWLMARRLNHL